MLNRRNANIIFLMLFAFLLLSGFFVKVEWYWFLALFGARLVVLIIGSSMISSNFHVRAFCSNPHEKQKRIAITFDDGPAPNTLLVLDVLKKHQAKAAFFCIGKNIEQYPEIFKRIDSEGHLIGNHSYSHSHFFDFYGKQKIKAEIEKTDGIIKKSIGIKTKLFRPPYGVTNPAISNALKATKHKVIGWNIRSLDGVLKNENIIFNRIVKRISTGGIVLLHDTTLPSVQVLERLLQFLAENNYEVVSLEQLLEIKAYED